LNPPGVTAVGFRGPVPPPHSIHHLPVLLISGLDDWVPLAEVNSVVIDNHLANTPRERQHLVLRIIRSLVEDGLMEIGDLPSTKGTSKLDVWDLPLDAAMAQVSDRFIGHYDDVARWGYSVWLDLIDAGELVARALAAQGTK
jgi:hypothetical protein